MNRNVAVKILLLLSIVLQSFNAVSASLNVHQVDVQHLETVHDHASDIKSLAANQVNELEGDEHNINDCHHCGHCSGSHFSWVSVKAFSPGLSKIYAGKFFKEASFPSHISTAIFRPPIA